MTDHREPHDGRDPGLERLLQSPQPPDSLAERVRANLAQQIGEEARRSRGAWRHATAATVALALLASGWWWWLQPPATVVAAYDDMQRDRGLHGVLDGGAEPWLKARAIEPPAGPFTLALSKDCLLDRRYVKHLRLVSDAGTVNLFIDTDGEATRDPRAAEGAYRDRRWLIVRPRGGMTVIVLFEQPAARDRVQALLASMFPADLTSTAPPTA